ncbi:dynein axonemal assembly factor 4 [Nothobranchius furzeri]|uniref:Dynein axonemal assembly factor 4 n=1 Tax=Nothobranchius furzeri TaxID=105023 RepID=A0A8C6PN67_NOTFU
MPLHVTDYTWSQTDSAVNVSVPLKGAAPGRVDVMSTDQYLKVHFPPYLFEAFWFEDIDDERSSAKIGDGVAVFSLMKRTNRWWQHLMMVNDDKESKRRIREKALEKHLQKVSAEAKIKAVRKQAESKYALETMMELEDQERDRIQKMKDSEREKVSVELVAWQQNHPTPLRDNTKTPEHGSAKSGRNQPVHRETKRRSQEPPPPRAAGNIQITFTPRVFPTALRESQASEEEEWLRKQAEARRVVRADLEELEDLTQEERNPDWLKDKGDRCFVSGDYMGALNAYNLAIRLNKKMAALYANRAACHLKLRNLHKAIEDSSQALDLLTPAVEANASARVRAIVRRGSAFCQLQLYAEGLQDYEAALKIQPENKQLQEDTQRIRDMVQGCPPD